LCTSLSRVRNKHQTLCTRYNWLMNLSVQTRNVSDLDVFYAATTLVDFSYIIIAPTLFRETNFTSSNFLFLLKKIVVEIFHMNLGVPDLLAITFKVLRIEFHSPVVALVQPYVLSPYNTIRTSSWLPSSLSNQHMTSSVAYLQKKLPTTGKKGNACGECFGTGERFGRSVGAKWMDQPTFFFWNRETCLIFINRAKRSLSRNGVRSTLSRYGVELVTPLHTFSSSSVGHAIEADGFQSKQALLCHLHITR